MSVIVANGKNVTDGVAHRFLSMIDTDIPLVLVSRTDDFEFNEQLDSLRGKKWVLVDYVEYGWDWKFELHHKWGINSVSTGFLNSDEWRWFDDFVFYNSPAVTFKRELLKEQFSDYAMFPIEYPNWQPEIPTVSREEFESRPLSVFNFWGRSHEDRLKLHGDIWHHASKKGFSVCDNPFFINQFTQQEQGEKWVTLNIPHYARLPIEAIVSVNGMAKISISMPGAGIKCFRSTGESPCNSVMYCREDNLAWTYEWEHGVNCIKSEAGKELETIDEWLNNPKLYDIYLAGVATANKYRTENYIRDYIKPILAKL